MPIKNTRRAKITPAPLGLGAGPLGVPMIKQEQTQWCWAACADMTLDYYGNAGVAQCDFANWLFGQSGCCTIPTSSLCNRPCQVQDVSRVYTNWNIQSSLIQSNVAFSTLESEIIKSRPVEVAYAWTGGGGHVALVIQTSIINNRPVVRVNDPAYGSGGVYYDDLLTAYGMGQWLVTWTGIQR
jgi:hypothetical protein